MSRFIPWFLVGLLMATWLHLRSAPPPEPPRAQATAGPPSLLLPWAARGYPTTAPTAGPSPTPVFPDRIEAVTVDAGLAYVGSGEQLYIIEVQDAEHPRVLASVETGIPNGSGWFVPRIVVRSGLAYLLSVNEMAVDGAPTANSQLVIFDVASPTRPQLLGKLEMAEIAFDMIATERALVLATARSLHNSPGRGALTSLSLADPARPMRMPSVELPFHPLGMTSDDGSLLVAGFGYDNQGDSNGALGIMTLSQDGVPMLDWRHRYKEIHPFSPASTGDTLAIISERKVHLIDRRRPELVVPFDDPEERQDCYERFVVAMEDQLIVRNACYGPSSDLQVLTIQPGEPDSPVSAEVIGQLDLPHSETLYPFLHPMVASGNRVYLVTVKHRGARGGTFYIVDVSDPTRPELAATLR